MQPLKHADADRFSAVQFVLCDLDDTLTHDGRLPASSYAALEQLQDAGKQVIVITGRPAGWCDMIARFWPVAGVVGENGAFYFRYRHAEKQMLRVFQRTDEQRAVDRKKLFSICDEVLAAVPGAALSVDQPYRISDVAVDFCEDVPALPQTDIDRIVDLFAEAGATVKVSSIHVNAWIGDFSKVEMSCKMLADEFGVAGDALQQQVAYAGDSPNDEPMFAFFQHSVGVANVRRFTDRMRDLPAWVTEKEGGYGFTELAKLICKS